MKRTTYQVPELRDENDNIIQEGTFGKKTPLANAEGTGWIDYVANDLEALRSALLGQTLMFATASEFPTAGDESKIYAAQDTGKAYQWNGTAYTELDTQAIDISVIHAKEYAEAAKASESASEASALAASASEQAAKSSETAAATSAGNASTSEANAKASETAAGESAAGAAGSASDAAVSAGQAAASESNAKTSEANAGQSESAAATSAVEAATSALASASSASAAKTSETNAKTSETNAAASAASAANRAKTQQSDWGSTDTSSMTYIKNKPSVVTVDTAQTITAAKTMESLNITGEANAPTPNTDNNSTAIATTAFVRTAIAALVDSAPDTLNTLNELATALGNDANFAATVASNIAGKVAKTGDTITGPILYDAMPNLGTELVNGNYVEETVARHHHYIQRNMDYNQGDVLTSPSLPPGCVIVVTQAGTTGSTEPDWTTIKSNMGGGN